VTYNVILQPFLSWFSTGLEIPLPPLADGELLLFLLGTLLGVAGMRTAEKIKGVTTS
jgi:hypothetical protein